MSPLRWLTTLSVRVRTLPRAVLAAAFIFALLVCIFVYAMSAPGHFPTGIRIEIPSGTSIAESAQIVARSDAVRSPLLLHMFLVTRGGVQAGTYQFPEPLSAFGVAHALAEGEHTVPLQRITIPEGLDNRAIAAIVRKTLPWISDEEFLAAASGKEGYLFPETYYIPEEYTADDVVILMEKTFWESFEALAELQGTSARTLSEIVIMASILEREANDEESMRTVSGILWKRLDEGIALQVDASFSYLLGKASAELTEEDLAIDSPYNTYRYPGLPPAPISNPGLLALRAALDPLDTPYFFYLTADDGTFYYARTFEEHVVNKRLYLN